MRMSLFPVLLCGIMAGFSWGQTQDLPPETPVAKELSAEEMLNDREFVKLLGQMPDRFKLPDELSDSSQKLTGIANWPEINVPPPTPPRLLVTIVIQQLTQLDNVKRELLHDLRNAETCGYRAVRLMPNETDGYDIQTDFQSRRYVTTRSIFDWAIHGEGFFMLRKLQSPNAGESAIPDENDLLYYSRAGRFELTDDHKLCLKHRGKIYLLEPEIDYSTWRVVALDSWPFQLASIDHPEQLRRIDGVLFQMETGANQPELFSPNALPDTTLRPMEYEASNVDFEETLHTYRALHRLQSAMLEQLSQ